MKYSPSPISPIVYLSLLLSDDFNQVYFAELDPSFTLMTLILLPHFSISPYDTVFDAKVTLNTTSGWYAGSMQKTSDLS